MKNILKYINSIPFSLTVGHYYPFHETTKLLKDSKLDSSESWDALRQNHPHFSISENRDEWISVNESLTKKDGQDKGLIERARNVVDIVKQVQATSIFSSGVGGAGLEYHIKKMYPEVSMSLGEFSTITVNLLKKVFLEAERVIYFDMKKSDWKEALLDSYPNRQLTLLYRIDIELSNVEMKEMFKKMHDAGIENILIILCGRLTIRGLLGRLKQRLIWKLKGVSTSFSGYLRSEKTFLQFWGGLYSWKEVECAGLKGFLLKKINVV